MARGRVGSVSSKASSGLRYGELEEPLLFLVSRYLFEAVGTLTSIPEELVRKNKELAALWVSPKIRSLPEAIVNWGTREPMASPLNSIEVPDLFRSILKGGRSDALFLLTLSCVFYNYRTLPYPPDLRLSLPARPETFFLAGELAEYNECDTVEDKQVHRKKRVPTTPSTYGSDNLVFIVYTMDSVY
ncbi:hypothetical protein COLO4_03947 [Corchorus olitorius]|uniref:Uncharacterized protein n=1 Tax=Corchorus olitorius TaxID=93759 RepID=A0A1R3KW06_9ROSI|nr:hypothetical protein COLO4_03947 [Corchorus olitorius]